MVRGHWQRAGGQAKECANGRNFLNRGSHCGSCMQAESWYDISSSVRTAGATAGSNLLRRNPVATDVVRNRYINRVAIFIDLRGKVTLQTNAFDDIKFSRPLPEKYSRGFPRFGKHLGRDDFEVVVQYVLALQVYAFDDAHVTVVRDRRGFANSNEGLRGYADRVHDQRIALPMADRVAVKSRIRVVGMRAAIRVYPAQPVAVGFAKQRDAAGR